MHFGSLLTFAKRKTGQRENRRLCSKRCGGWLLLSFLFSLVYDRWISLYIDGGKRREKREESGGVK
jgi:hypothetical protein